jgi:hypothetical protein
MHLLKVPHPRWWLKLCSNNKVQAQPHRDQVKETAKQMEDGVYPGAKTDIGVK